MRWKEAFDSLPGLHGLKPDWDSYGALAIDSRAIFSALEFILKLPSRIDIDSPVVVPHPHGGVEFEWDCFGISFDRMGNAVYEHDDSESTVSGFRNIYKALREIRSC